MLTTHRNTLPLHADQGAAGCHSRIDHGNFGRPDSRRRCLDAGRSHHRSRPAAEDDQTCCTGFLGGNKVSKACKLRPSNRNTPHLKTVPSTSF